MKVTWTAVARTCILQNTKLTRSGTSECHEVVLQSGAPFIKPFLLMLKCFRSLLLQRLRNFLPDLVLKTLLFLPSPPRYPCNHISTQDAPPRYLEDSSNSSTREPPATAAAEACNAVSSCCDTHGLTHVQPPHCPAACRRSTCCANQQQQHGANSGREWHGRCRDSVL